MRTRKARGLTIVQTLVAASLLVVVLAGANAMVTASNKVAQSTNDLGTASNRADRTLEQLSDTIRRGSLASMLKLDDTYFAPDASGSGFKIRTVQSFRGTPVLSSVITFQLDKPTGALSGSLTRTQDGVTRVLATGITGFTVTRLANRFALEIATRAGPNDDRARKIQAKVLVTARNP